MWWSWKDWFWTVSILGGCGSLERTDFEQFLLSEGLVVLKGLSLNSFYFGRLWWSWKNSFWTVSILRGCGGLERTNFEQFLLSEGAVVGCGAVVVLNGLILNSFYFGRVWWSWKNSFWTVSTLGGSGGHEITDFEHILLSEGVVVSKELILNSFYFRRVWWCWKNWFWTVSTLGWYGGRVWWSGGLERTNFEQFLLSQGVVVLKGLILKSFYFGRLWWSWKNSFWTVSILRGCGGLERTNFEQFLLSEGAVLGCGGVVVLNGLILNSFHFGRVWWSRKNWFWTVSTLGGSGGHEITDFEHILFSEGVVVLKELILNSFYFRRVWWSWKNWFWTVSTLGWCGGRVWWSGGLERTDFEQFLLSQGVVVLKGLILNSFYFGRLWWSRKSSFWTVSTLRGCGGLERTDFEHILLSEGCGGHERTGFQPFLFWEGVMVVKELILNNFYFQRVWWSWKN